jgi:hypothetical protein
LKGSCTGNGNPNATPGGQKQDLLVQPEQLQDHDDHDDHANDVKDAIHIPLRNSIVGRGGKQRSATTYRGTKTVKAYIIVHSSRGV